MPDLTDEDLEDFLTTIALNHVAMTPQGLEIAEAGRRLVEEVRRLREENERLREPDRFVEVTNPNDKERSFIKKAGA